MTPAEMLAPLMARLGAVEMLAQRAAEAAPGPWWPEADPDEDGQPSPTGLLLGPSTADEVERGADPAREVGGLHPPVVAALVAAVASPDVVLRSGTATKRLLIRHQPEKHPGEPMVCTGCPADHAGEFFVPWPCPEVRGEFDRWGVEVPS